MGRVARNQLAVGFPRYREDVNDEQDRSQRRPHHPGRQHARDRHGSANKDRIAEDVIGRKPGAQQRRDHSPSHQYTQPEMTEGGYNDQGD
ncbi:MAG: hypothetical protein ABIL01_07860, partial [Pseudomonadota bacterium]